MDPTIIVALVGAAATITAAIIARLGGKKAGREEGREEKAKEIDDAPRKYVDHLDRLIRTAVREGDSKAILNARAIVSLRNDLKGSMMRISEQLNKEIDRLAEEIGEPVDRTAKRSKPEPPAVVFETLQVLEKRWPGKKDQVEVELRKVLAELGLLGRAPARAREEEQEPPPPPLVATA